MKDAGVGKVKESGEFRSAVEYVLWCAVLCLILNTEKVKEMVRGSVGNTWASWAPPGLQVANGFGPKPSRR